MSCGAETLRQAELANAPDQLPAALLEVLPLLAQRKQVSPHNIQRLLKAVLSLECLLNRLSKEFQFHEQVEFLACVLIAGLEVGELGEIERGEAVAVCILEVLLQAIGGEIKVDDNNFMEVDIGSLVEGL